MVRERGSGKTPQRVVEKLKEAIAEKGLLGLENATGVGKSALSRYAKGIGEPTTATLQKLADYFEVSVAYLRGEKNSSDWLKIAKELLDKNSDLDSNQELKALLKTKRNEFNLEYNNNLKKFKSIIIEFSKIPPEERKDAIDTLRTWSDIEQGTYVTINPGDSRYP